MSTATTTQITQILTFTYSTTLTVTTSIGTTTTTKYNDLNLRKRGFTTYAKPTPLGTRNLVAGSESSEDDALVMPRSPVPQNALPGVLSQLFGLKQDSIKTACSCIQPQPRCTTVSSITKTTSTAIRTSSVTTTISVVGTLTTSTLSVKHITTDAVCRIIFPHPYTQLSNH